MKQFFIVLLLCVISAINAISASAQVINTLFYHYPKWSEELEERAKTDFTAKTVVGYYYLNGTGVRRDADAAFKWISEAVSQEHDDIARAYFLMGECYKNGYGVEANGAVALSFYKKSLECKNPFTDSYIEIALLYEFGDSVDLNPDMALRYYEDSIKYCDNYIASRSYIGKGRILGRRKQYTEAADNFNKALNCNSGRIGRDKCIDAIAYMQLGIMHYLMHDYNKEVEYLKCSINTDYVIAEVVTELGNCYYEGRGVNQNKEKAKALYESAAKRGDLEAANKLNELTFK